MKIRIRTENNQESPRLIDLEFCFEKITHIWVEEDSEDPEKKNFLKEYKLVETGEKVNLLFQEDKKESIGTITIDDIINGVKK